MEHGLFQFCDPDGFLENPTERNEIVLDKDYIPKTRSYKVINDVY